MATKKKTKKRKHKVFTPAERAAAVKAYNASAHGEGKHVLKKLGVSYSLVHHWMAKPELMKGPAKKKKKAA